MPVWILSFQGTDESFFTLMVRYFTGLCCLCLYTRGDLALNRHCLQFDCLLSLLGIVFCTWATVEARAPTRWLPLSYIYEQSSSNNRQYTVLWPGVETIL